MLQYGFGNRIKGMRVSGPAIVDALKFRMVPEEEVHFHHIFYIYEITGLFPGSVTVVPFKQLYPAFLPELVIHLKRHGSHLSLMVFLRTVHIKIA